MLATGTPASSLPDGRRLGEQARGGQDPRQRGTRNLEELQEFVVPGSRAQVEELGPRGVAEIGRVKLATRKLQRGQLVHGAQADRVRALSGIFNLAGEASTGFAGGKKRGSMVNPVRSRRNASRPCSRRRWQKSAVRRHRQMTAGPRGRPLERSQARTVSRWLEIPIAANRAAGISPRGTAPGRSSTAFQMASGTPARPIRAAERRSPSEPDAAVDLLASRSTTMAFVLDVPRSMAEEVFGHERSSNVVSPANETAVDDEINAGAKGSRLAQEEHGRPHHFVDSGHPLERGVRFKLFDLFGDLSAGDSSASPYSPD